MGYTQIVFTEQDLEPWNLSRQVTPAEEQAFPGAESQLEQLGFDTSAKDNWLRLWNAFDKSPQTPITVGNIVATAKAYPNVFIWVSPEEVEYRKLSTTIGPEKVALVNKLLNSHGLFASSAVAEGGLENFVALVRHGLNQGWGLTDQPGAFQRLIGHYRANVPNAHLYWKPTPHELRRQKEREEQAKKDQAWHEEYTRFHDPRRKDPEFLKAEAEKERLAAIQEYNDKWHSRVTDYIASIRSNNLRLEAEQQFSQPHRETTNPMGGSSWHQTYINLEHWVQRQKNLGRIV